MTIDYFEIVGGKGLSPYKSCYAVGWQPFADMGINFNVTNRYRKRSNNFSLFIKQ